MIFDNIPWSNFHELNLNWILEVMKKLDISFDELKKAINAKDAEQDENIKTLDGYFVAYIPETWDDITFGTTGLDIEVPCEPEYGHLVLSY